MEMWIFENGPLLGENAGGGIIATKQATIWSRMATPHNPLKVLLQASVSYLLEYDPPSTLLHNSTSFQMFVRFESDFYNL